MNAEAVGGRIKAVPVIVRPAANGGGAVPWIAPMSKSSSMKTTSQDPSEQR
jgi:hypothetical protein